MRAMIRCSLAALACAVAARAGEPAPPRTYRMTELSFTAARDYPDALAVPFDCVFTGPAGKTLRVPGFWDGERAWKVRFMPPAPGRWTYRTECPRRTAIRSRVVYRGRPAHGGDEPVKVEADVSGADRIRLLVGDGGDGSAWDHADWGEARFTARDGSATYAEELVPVRARQGHKELAVRQNLVGSAMRIGTTAIVRGLATHAESEIVYELGGRFERFVALAGVDAVAGDHGSVVFSVVTETPETVERDPGLDGIEGEIRAAPPTGDNPLYARGGMLRVAPDGRHLTYSDGSPFFWLGDTWWFSPGGMTPFEGSSNPEIPSAYKALIDLRARQRFSVVQMAFLGSRCGETAPAEETGTGGPNLAAWREADRCMGYANDAGILPAVGLAFHSGMDGKSLDEWERLWRYAVGRLGSYAVTWFICGEYNAKHVPERVGKVLALGRFIKSADPYRRAMTVHPWALSVDTGEARDEDWCDFIMVQGGHGRDRPVPLSEYAKLYDRRPAKPLLEAECRYEGIRGITPEQVQEAAYRAIQAGSFGYTYGAHGLWYPTQSPEDTTFEEDWGESLPWWEAMRRPGADRMTALRAIFESVDWWRLVPRPTAVVPLPTPGPARTHLIYRFADARAEAARDCALRYENGRPDDRCILLHPLAGGDPATLTFDGIAVPETRAGARPWLLAAVGLDPITNLNDPAHPSDGVECTVSVNGTPVGQRTVTSHDWQPLAVDLSAHAGRTVRITFAMSARENENWDHALIRGPVVGSFSAAERAELSRKQTNPLGQMAEMPAKADGDRVFLVYVPADAPTAGLGLHGGLRGASYDVEVRDPVTGTGTPAGTAVSHGDGLIPLPETATGTDRILVLRRLANTGDALPETRDR